MSGDQTTDPSADEQIVAAPPGAGPGAADGVGEHVLQGMGHDGVRRMEGEFAELDDATASSPRGWCVGRLRRRAPHLSGSRSESRGTSWFEARTPDLWLEIVERRSTNMRRFAAELGDTGQLAIPVKEAADIIWATNSPELYAFLVQARGWTTQWLGRWLSESWERMLLSPGTGALP